MYVFASEMSATAYGFYISPMHLYANTYIRI